MAKEFVIAQRKRKVVYKDGDKAVKLFDDIYKKSSVLNEALNQVRVEETGLKMAKLRSVELIEGKWAIVSDYIAGKTLQQLMEENPDKIDDYLELFVNLQIEVYSKSSPLLINLKDKMNSKIENSDLDATIRYDLHSQLSGMPKHNKVCHGDFVPSNIIINDEGEAYIIDWSHATQGNASADVARTYMVLCLYYSEEIAVKYLNLYCKKTDTARQYVQKWMPIVAAAQLSKSSPKEKEFLLKWIDAVGY